MVQQTSILSYIQTKIYGDLGTKQRMVYDAISDLGTASDEQILNYLVKNGLYMFPHLISARRNELMEKGLVKQIGTGFNHKTNRKVIVWGLS